VLTLDFKERMKATALDWLAYLSICILCIIVFATGDQRIPYPITLVFIACLALNMIQTKE
jgi:hypothetical protein